MITIHGAGLSRALRFHRLAKELEGIFPYLDYRMEIRWTKKLPPRTLMKVGRPASKHLRITTTQSFIDAQDDHHMLFYLAHELGHDILGHFERTTMIEMAEQKDYDVEAGYRATDYEVNIWLYQSRFFLKAHIPLTAIFPANTDEWNRTVEWYYNRLKAKTGKPETDKERQ
jgi:hypothetical protein